MFGFGGIKAKEKVVKKGIGVFFVGFREVSDWRGRYSQEFEGQVYTKVGDYAVLNG
jgi:hypothetical protein